MDQRATLSNNLKDVLESMLWLFRKRELDYGFHNNRSKMVQRISAIICDLDTWKTHLVDPGLTVTTMGWVLTQVMTNKSKFTKSFIKKRDETSDYFNPYKKHLHIYFVRAAIVAKQFLKTQRQNKNTIPSPSPILECDGVGGTNKK